MGDVTEAKQNVVSNDMLGFETNCKRFVIDPLYGPVALTETEFDVLQTRLFQRLRHIKQLGFVSNLYPGANHSRFEHSVGTLYTTWELFKRFIVNSISHNVWLHGFKLDSFNKPTTLQALRLSGLLHDLGHGPYSHTFETIFDDFQELKLLNHESLTLYMLSYGFDKTIESSRNTVVEGLLDIINKSSDWQHIQKYRAELSATIGNSSLQRHILMILNDALEFDDFEPSERFREIRSFLNELITGDIGSDRIDYLLRDTYFTGLGHRFNLHQVLESILGIFDTQKGILRIAVDAETRNAVEFLLTTRYYHYRLIAHNPANLDLEFDFRRRLRLDPEKDPVETLHLAALDEYKIQSHLSSTGGNYSRVFTSDLRDIKVNPFRFFFYRVATDSALRKRYVETIKKNIAKATRKYNPSSRITSREVHVEIVLEKPHVPILHVYREKYRVEKDDAIEYHSILLHDWSDIIPALARTYILDSLFMVYVSREYASDVRTALSLSRKFYLSRVLFRKFLEENLAPGSIHRLDVLLFSIFEATKRGSQPILKIQNLFDEIKRTQRRLGTKTYKIEKCYSAENEKSFDYCRLLLNDLFVLAVSEVIGIDIKYTGSKKENGKPTWKAKYEISPVFDWIIDPILGVTRREASNLKRILDFYPQNIIRLFSKSE